MLNLREDFREPRDWARPWRDKPGFFFPGCNCCATGPSIYLMGGASATTSFEVINHAYSPSGDSWTPSTDLPTPGRSSFGGCTISSKIYIQYGVKGGIVTEIRDNDEFDG